MLKLNQENAKKLFELINKALDERAEPQNVDFLVKSDVLNMLTKVFKKLEDEYY